MTYGSNEIRKMFLNFFHKKDHAILPGSTLIPNNDPSLLFTNAGMNQFKDIFLEENFDFKYTKVATLQHCLRTGGKHNDLKNVGYTLQHHTFFEMLGNFSFRDYFKLDAILYAWEFLTSKQQLHLPKDKLWITVYKDDLESYHIWKNIIKIDNRKIIKIGDKEKQYNSDNFWSMGETGPCGPSTEIFYDFGSDFIETKFENHISKKSRFIEIWNIVFIQFNKINDHKLIKLNKPSVDTGMGLERITAAVNNINSNYEIDLFKPLIQHISEISTKKILNKKSLYVIADHIRSSAFIITEDIIPSNEKHGYVLRRIIRRAIRHGYNLGIKSLFLHKLIPTLINVMGESGLKLQNKQQIIKNILISEEKKFILTLEKGLILLEKTLNKLPGKILNGEIAFKLYDTFGFPIDLTIDICKERNISVNYLEFKQFLEKHKKQSLNKEFLKTKKSNIKLNDENKKTIFVGYKANNITCLINKISIENNIVKKIDHNQSGIIFLNKTPFYGESGGQIGDSGIISNSTGTFIVKDTKYFGNIIGHIGILTSGYFNVNDTVEAKINILTRKLIQNNHTATHLLHTSLRKILGNHVSQRGSFVSDKIIKFDFSHYNPMHLYEIHQVEEIINQKIRDNIIIQEHFTTLKDIKNKNVMALFQEKYKNIVRMISINCFSNELCKGTHAKSTGDIGLFKITSETNISSGIRRIIAITGKIALDEIHNQEKILQKAATILKTTYVNLINRINVLINHNISLEKEKNVLHQQKICNIVENLSKKYTIVKNTKIIIENVNDENFISLRNIVDKLKNKFNSSIIIITSFINSKSIIIIGITNVVTNKISAKEILYKLTKKLGGTGGGKNNIAEGRIKNLLSLPIELKKIKKWIDSKL